MKAFPLIGTALVLAIWAATTASGLVAAVFLPPPWDVGRAMVRAVVEGGLASDAGLTIQRTLFGFFTGSIAGVVVGVLMGYHKLVYRALEFPLDFFRSIPATALFPLFIVIFGLGDEIKVFVAGWASGMVVAVNTIYGIQAVSQDRLLVARTKRVSFAKRFLLIIFPSALPFIIAGWRIGLSLALVVEVVAEMFLGGDGGLGRRIYNATTIFDMDDAYAAVLTIGLIGYLMNRSIIVLERKIVHWPA